MAQPGDTGSGTDGDPPLVIVSEFGRHSQESRRIVRAQAARASAALSRETRARNRGERPPTAHEASGARRRIQPASFIQSHWQSDPEQQRQTQDSPQPSIHDHPLHSCTEDSSAAATLKPLANWITNVLQLSADSLAAAALASDGVGSRTGPSTAAMEEVSVGGGLFSGKQLPMTLPRGFAALQRRIQIAGPFLLLLSRSACFDYDSPGVGVRLNQLLFDIVMTSATSTLVGDSEPTHPIQEHLRIASTCLIIWSGQRTEGAAFDGRHASGLEAAWQEAIVLDQNALKDAKSSEAALWAVFVISVTCGSAVNFFTQLIVGLLRDLQLQKWGDVRSVLIQFIYPGGTLDGPCKRFYDQLLADHQSLAG